MSIPETDKSGTKKVTVSDGFVFLTSEKRLEAAQAEFVKAYREIEPRLKGNAKIFFVGPKSLSGLLNGDSLSLGARFHPYCYGTPKFPNVGACANAIAEEL